MLLVWKGILVRSPLYLKKTQFHTTYKVCESSSVGEIFYQNAGPSGPLI